MCGIAALIGPGATAAAVTKMTREVAHRGPDGEGLALFELGRAGLVATKGTRADVALGHRRLAILDLTEAGHQPMRYGEDLWLTYNGEVYNYLELRAELSAAGHAFTSDSDTEVVLAAYRQWGTGCFERLRGMWGLVLVDGARRKAVLCRDRMGIKPLYFARAGETLAVASEIKQLAHVPGFRLRPRESALRQYLATGYEDSSRTFFDDVHALPAGTWAEVALDTRELSSPVSYWHPERVTVSIHEREEAARAFVSALRDSVRLHLRSDVPVGCALSGGLDSSTLAALAREASADGAPLHAFIATYPGEPGDERASADLAAHAVGATAHYVLPTAEDFLARVARFTWIHDEPVGALAQYSAYSLGRITREAGVPVTFNGQGGDELLSGYWQTYALYLRQLLGERRVGALAGHVLGSLAPGGNPALVRQFPWLARRYLEQRRGVSAGVGGTASGALGVLALSGQARRVHEVRELFLPRLLKWDDRNFMAFSVEGRYPFLDHVVIETALACAPETLCTRGWTKEPLRRGMEGLLPREILRRRDKSGFMTPQDAWLAGPMRGALSAWLADAAAPVWAYADRRALGQLAGRLEPTRPQTSAGDVLFRTFAADWWLRVMIHGERGAALDDEPRAAVA